MSTNATPTVKRRDWRTILFVVVAAPFTFLTLTEGLDGVLQLWGVQLGNPPLGPDIHRWHDAQWGALFGLLLGGSLLALLWRPRTKPLLMQFFVLGLAALTLLSTPWGGWDIPIFLAPFLLVIAAYPAPRALLDFSRKEPLSRLLLALSLLAAVLMFPDTWRSLLLQLANTDEHAQEGYWITVVILAIVLILGGVLAATKRPGWQALGIITGLAFLNLGVAAITVPNQPGSWGVVGGIGSLLGGLAFIAATMWESRTTMGARAPTEA